MNPFIYRKSLESFFMEDIGERDVTSDLLFPTYANGEMTLVTKQDGVFCGKDIIKLGYELLDASVEVTVHVPEGAHLAPGVQIATIQGPVRSLLKGERVILNLIQRMSGIATVTRKAVEIVGDSATRICDTRKTTPGLRTFEKYAVRAGGGYNHRFRLDDAVMLKDNHIAFAGSIAAAVETIRAELGHMIKIEVETESEEQVKEAVAAEVDCIMFDNRSPEEIRHLRTLVPSTITTEISGGIHLDNLAAYRDLGADYISLGSLTHSAPSLDISANVKPEEEN
ncbi:carboxylating nicotinate-nucleotide diphosphorylase [Halobacillus salinus]|uniref:Probable nicotinate-nucleotide pyrophosphorylase [carboxylating] n=1 Tax=Halobacillus salinus TaxID=192814 RepID=A0A4Z0GXT8_9BACI|nr:carboxylating nicotinate-nucleotide diphosphorylase [Halobacillus salinus]TGB01947.1 carboxylating nicotinate-nucleotide diphosphorylase [Halobacillus salinus]